MEFKVGGPDDLFFLSLCTLYTVQYIDLSRHTAFSLSPTSIKPSGSLPILASPSIRRLQTGPTSIPPPTLPLIPSPSSPRENNREKNKTDGEQFEPKTSNRDPSKGLARQIG